MMRKNKFLIVLLISVITLLIIVKAVPYIMFGLGNHFFKKLDYVKAYKYYSGAVKLSPGNYDFKYSYSLALSGLNPTLKVQREMFKLAEEPNEERAVFHARQQISAWNQKIFETYGDNYIEQAPYNSEVLRWNTSTFPLKVYTEPPSKLDIPEYYNREIINAFKQWYKSTGFIKFVFTDIEKEADVVVKFLPLPKSSCEDIGCKYVVAYTEPIIKGHQLKRMVMYLYDKDAYGNYFSDKEVYNTVLHEIGHVLGIMGHSYSTDDIMYMASQVNTKNNIFTRYRSNFQYISSKDINTIKLLYNLTPDITNTPINKIKNDGLIYAPIVLGSQEKLNRRKIKEAENYIQKAPNLPNGYIDLASAYADAGNIKKAVQNLKFALTLAKTENECYIINYNLAAIYLNNNMPKKALPYAEEAKKISNTEEISDMISNIKHSLATKKKPFKNQIKTNAD